MTSIKNGPAKKKDLKGAKYTLNYLWILVSLVKIKISKAIAFNMIHHISTVEILPIYVISQVFLNLLTDRDSIYRGKQGPSRFEC